MRCYNGCPDNELRTYLARISDAEKRLKAANPLARCTYFPIEEQYLVFLDNLPVGKMRYDKIQAIDEAIPLITGC